MFSVGGILSNVLPAVFLTRLKPSRAASGRAGAAPGHTGARCTTELPEENTGRPWEGAAPGPVRPRIPPRPAPPGVMEFQGAPANGGGGTSGAARGGPGPAGHLGARSPPARARPAGEGPGTAPGAASSAPPGAGRAKVTGITYGLLTPGQLLAAGSSAALF